MEAVIQCELFDHTPKWHKNKPESVSENEMHNFLWDFGMETDHLIQVRRQDLMLSNEKKKQSSSGFYHIDGLHSENKRNRKKKRQINGAGQRSKMLWNVRVTVISITVGVLGTVHQELIKKNERNLKKGWIHIIKTAVFLRSVKHWDESWKPEKTYCPSGSSERSPTNAGWNTYQE